MLKVTYDDTRKLWDYIEGGKVLRATGMAVRVQTTKECPMCTEMINYRARVCPHCGRDI